MDKTEGNKIEDVDINTLNAETFYRVVVLQGVLKKKGLNYSIFTIRDYETWKCLNYKCGKRHNEEVKVCSKCGGPVRAPLIQSPRTRGGGKGIGHRRYSLNEILSIVELFQERD